MSETGGARAVVRVAVVDDSSFIRKALLRILERDSRIEVVGTAASGEELLDRLDDWRPDAITLDISMPGMGGLATLDHLQTRRPTPVIVLSTHTGKDAPLTIEALHRGAVDFINKKSFSLVDFQSLGAVLTEKIFQVAGTPRAAAAAEPEAGALEAAPVSRPAFAPARTTRSAASRFGAVLLGASTGGPVAIQRVLEDLGAELPVPVVIVQHMPEGFTAHFADRLNAHLPMAVREAGDREPLLPGTAYLAPAGRNLEVRARGTRLETLISERPDGSPAAPHCPSIDRLFRSAAESLGARTVAALLTGMGRDGAAGLSELARRGAHTLAQDEATSVVYGMPRAAFELGAAREVLPLEQIGPRARSLVLGEVSRSAAGSATPGD